MSNASQTAEVVKGATIIATMSEPSSSAVGPGTAYSIQMTECQTCTKNTQTINTMLTVMHQQATTVKDQQGTIANLITMLSNATGSTPVKMQHLTGRQSGPHLTASGKRSHHKKPIMIGAVPIKLEMSTPRGRGRQSTGSAAKKRKAEDGDVSENGVSAQEFVVKHNRASESGVGEDGESIIVPIMGTPHEKCPCPLEECEGRKFAAADMYYMRRHFQQVHRLTHPNPIFMIRCPVEDCGAEFEQSLREMRKHLSKDHPDAFPPRSSSKGHSVGDEEGDEEPMIEGDDGGEDAEAAAELASEDD